MKIFRPQHNWIINPVLIWYHLAIKCMCRNWWKLSKEDCPRLQLPLWLAWLLVARCCTINCLFSLLTYCLLWTWQSSHIPHHFIRDVNVIYWNKAWKSTKRAYETEFPPKIGTEKSCKKKRQFTDILNYRSSR